MSKKLTTEQFIKRSNQKHNNKYDYSKIKYKNVNIKVIIICPIHGEFEQRPNSHLKGKGCKQCGYILTRTKKTNNIEEFIQKGIEIHKNKYDYSKTIYIKSRTKIIIICPDHGEFKQIASNHLSGHGCQKCATISKKKI